MVRQQKKIVVNPELTKKVLAPVNLPYKNDAQQACAQLEGYNTSICKKRLST